MDEVDEEISSLKKEYKWILKEEVDSVLKELKATLSEACGRFPGHVIPGEENVLKTERFVLSSPNGSQHIKCMLTLLSESICDADLTYKVGNKHSPQLSKIHPDAPWRLSQIQDAGNHLFRALSYVDDKEGNSNFSSGQEILHLLKLVTESLNRGRSSLAMPKRKTLDDLIKSPNMKCLKPALPSDIVVSFYVQAQKIVLCLYTLCTNSAHKLDISARHQVECSVPWLNDILVFFTLALQLCQQLQDKVTVFMQYEAELETKLLPSKVTTPCDNNQTLINISPTEATSDRLQFATKTTVSDGVPTEVQQINHSSITAVTAPTNSPQTTKKDLLVDFT